MSVPAELGYTKEHEWVAINEGIATVGITAFAAEALGDIVYVEPPEVGSTVTAGESCGEIDLTSRSASSILRLTVRLSMSTRLRWTTPS